MSEEQRDLESGPLSSVAASDADDEPTDTEPVQTTEAQRPFFNYAPYLKGLVRSASAAVRNLAREPGARSRTAASPRADRQRPRPSASRDGTPSGQSRSSTPRRRPRSAEDGNREKLGTPTRRRLSYKQPAQPVSPVAREFQDLPEFPIEASDAGASGENESFSMGPVPDVAEVADAGAEVAEAGGEALVADPDARFVAESGTADGPECMIDFEV